MNTALAWAIVVVAAYLLGSLSGSLLLGRLRGVDIRTLGSGNAGSTNAFRTQGLAFATGVMLVDVGKAVLATALARHYAPQLGLPVEAAMVAAGIAVLVGHVWPLFHGFRGGKGAATAVGALLVLWPPGALVGVLAWIPVLVLGGWVSVATIVAAFALFVASLWPGMPGASPLVALYAGFVALAMAWTHRANLARLRAGNEHRFERVRVLHRRRAP